MPDAEVGGGEEDVEAHPQHTPQILQRDAAQWTVFGGRGGRGSGARNQKRRGSEVNLLSAWNRSVA